MDLMITVTPLAYASSGYHAAVDLRRRVLRAPLGLDFMPEQLAAEVSDTHLGAFDKDRLVGAVMLTPYGSDGFKLRQMVVAPERHGQGIGALLLAAAEAEAVRQNRRHIMLAARVTAEGFYAHYGYASEGDTFIEVTIPHIRMTKRL